MTTPTRNTKNTNTHTPTIIQQNDVASPNNQANAVNVQINPLVQSKTVAVTAFYKLHHTTISQGRFSYKDLFTFDIMQQSAVVNGDHFDFLLSKIPQDFGFIGFVDSDLGGGKYIISVITGEEYRRNVDQETGKVDIPGETPTLVPGETPEKNAKKPKILQVSMKLPVDSQKCVKRLLFGPKSCLSVDEPVLPYAFVSDNILVSRDDLEDFCDCERMLIWFFIKDHPECKKKQGFKDLLLAHFDHAKKFQLLSSANQINLFDSDLDFALESAFGNLNELTKDAFMAFWSWYGLAIRILLKVCIFIFGLIL